MRKQYRRTVLGSIAVKTAPSLVTLLVLGFLFSGESQAARLAPEPDRVVFPTGQWPTDVENVQAAVDFGGTVLLKATDIVGRPTAFNFGVYEGDPRGRLVALQGNIWLLGETAGSARTTIRGGYRPILVGRTVTGEPLPTGHVRIGGITFEASDQAVIDVYQATRVEIVNNRILDVIGDNGVTVGLSIFGGGVDQRITGKVTIADNIIRFAAAGDFTHALVLADLAADVDIMRNSIAITESQTGILVVRQVEGTVRIVNNYVSIAHPEALIDGIGIYIFANDLWDGIRSSSPVFQVIGNLVRSNGYGIGLVADRGSIEAPLIERNHISILGQYSWAEGMFIGGNVSRARVSSNWIGGSGAYGIDVFGFESGQLSESNKFFANDLTHFSANTTHYFLDTITLGNVVVGKSGTVVDLGTGNKVKIGK